MYLILYILAIAPAYTNMEVIKSSNPLPTSDEDNIADYDDEPAVVHAQTTRPDPDDVFDNFGRNLPPIKREDLAPVYNREEQELRIKLIAKIKSAKKSFPEDTGSLDITNLDKLTTLQLQDQIESITKILESGSSVDMGGFAIVKFAELIETLTADTGLKLKGIAKDIERDKNLMKMLKTLAWQYDSMFEWPLSVRITIQLSFLAFFRHKANEETERNAIAYNRPAKEETVKTYADL